MESYERPFYEDEQLLNSFLSKWSITNIENMTLEEYTDVKNQHTFTRWVEGKTRSLGSINGPIGSAKFGIYKRLNSRKPERVFSNEVYSWIRYYGECELDEQVVFKKVKEELIQLIQFSQQLDFDAVEKVKGFYELYKWKVAFLYSNQSMIPIFNQRLLIKFTQEYGMKHSKRVEYAKMHRFLYNQKPPNQSVFNFMRGLFHEDETRERKKRDRKGRKTRRGTKTLNSDDQVRKGTKETIVTQHHKKLQKRLKKFLETKHPNAEITFEKNFIDLLLISDTEVHYYEVKTALTPENCIKKGLGQLLSYSYHEEQILKKYKGLAKRIIIFGLLKANEKDLQFIDYINRKLNVNFEYLSLEEINSSPASARLQTGASIRVEN
ncbi:MAG: hypothetical protein Aureis2KO_32020 [Aureisphaera sp.]